MSASLKSGLNSSDPSPKPAAPALRHSDILPAPTPPTAVFVANVASAVGALHAVQKAWLEHDVPQCGYCQCGMIMAAAALLKEKPKPTDADIDAAITNICRCGTFQQARAAIHAAANA